MKVGDLVLHRMAWVQDPYDDVPILRHDDGEWSDPVLIVDQYPPPDEGLYVALDGAGRQIVISETPGLTDVKVISEG